MTDDRLSRRAFLGGVTAGTLLLAGCSGSESTSTPTQSGLLGGTGGPGTATGDGRGTEGDDSDRTVDTDHPSAVVGEGILTESVGFRVEGSTRYQQLGGLGKAPSGREYLVVVLSVKNRGDEMLDTNNLESFRLTNGGTTRERVGLVSQTGSRFTQGLIVPGGTIRGFVAFEVASGSEGWSFAFDVDSQLTTIERVTVDLAEQQQPASLFHQSYRVPVHDVGGSVTAADLTVTVTDVRTTKTVAKTKAADGQEFLLPTVRVENKKDRTAYIGLTSQLLLVDDRGTPQALDLGIQQQIRNAFPLNPNVESGSHVEGEIPYVVDTGASPLYFSFDFTSNGAEQKSIWQLR